MGIATRWLPKVKVKVRVCCLSKQQLQFLGERPLSGYSRSCPLPCLPCLYTPCTKELLRPTVGLLCLRQGLWIRTRKVLCCPRAGTRWRTFCTQRYSKGSLNPHPVWIAKSTKNRSTDQFGRLVDSGSIQCGLNLVDRRSIVDRSNPPSNLVDPWSIIDDWWIIEMDWWILAETAGSLHHPHEFAHG